MSTRLRAVTLCGLVCLAACQAEKTTLTTHPKGDQLAPPTGLVATPAKGSVKLEWNPVPGAVSYEVYRAATSDSNPYNLIAATGNTSYRDVVGFTNLLQQGTTYHYRVMAKTGTGYDGTPTYIDSEPSAPVSALLADVPAQGAQLAAPTVTLTDVNGTVRYISWTEVPNATYYDVYRANTFSTFVDDTTPLSMFSTVATNQTSLVVGEALSSPSTRFAYTVVARKSDAYYLPSAKSIVVFNDPVKRLNTPDGAASAGTYTDKILVEWDKIPGATSYRVYRAESRSTTSPDLDPSAVVTPYALVPNLTFATYQGQTTRIFVEDRSAEVTASTNEGGIVVPRYYWYKVQAVGDATWADSALGAADLGYLKPDGQTPYSVIDAPAAVTTVNNGTNGAFVTVRWQKVLASATKLAATSYDVYRAKDSSLVGFTRIGTGVAGTAVPAAANELEYQDSSATLEKGANYYYRVVAKAAGGLESELSSASGAGYLAGLDPFTSFTAVVDASTNVQLTWSRIRNVNTGAGAAYTVRALLSGTAPANPLVDGIAVATVSGATSDRTNLYFTGFGAFAAGTWQLWVVATGNDGQQGASAAVAVVR